MTNLDSILKSKDVTLLTKVHLVKAMVFPVVMYGCESWTINFESVPKNWCFWTMVLEKILRVPWTARWSNQSILREINPEYSLEGLMLKLQYFGHLMWRTDSLEKTLMLGKIEGQTRGWQRMKWLDDITDYGHEFEQAPGDGERQESLMCRSPWSRKELDTTEWLNWTEWSTFIKSSNCENKSMK